MTIPNSPNLRCRLYYQHIVKLAACYPYPPADETVRTWWDDPKTPQSDYRQLFILGGAGQGAVHAVQFSAAPPPRRRRAAAATTSRPAATDAGHFDSSGAAGPEITAASFASLAAAAVGRPVGAGGGEVETASTRESTPAGRPSAPGVAAPPPRGGSGPDGDGEEVDENEEDRRHAEEELPLMAYACGSGVVRLWSPVAQRQLGLLRGMEGPVGSVSFSEDGRLLATADQSGGWQDGWPMKSDRVGARFTPRARERCQRHAFVCQD